MKTKLCTCGHSVDYHAARGETGTLKRCTLIGCTCRAVQPTNEVAEIPAVMTHGQPPGNNHHTGSRGALGKDPLIPCDCDYCARRYA